MNAWIKSGESTNLEAAHIRPRGFTDPIDDLDDNSSKMEKSPNVEKRAVIHSGQVMNLYHFEKLMKTFNEHKNEGGSQGFDIDKFREVFIDVLGGNMSFDQMTMLFMKIDANSDGTVDWDEFSSYMMAGTFENDQLSTGIVFDTRARHLANNTHKDLIKTIDFWSKERKYITVGRDGLVGLWSQKLRLQRMVKTTHHQAWVSDSCIMQELNKLIVVSDDRKLCVFDILNIKPRIIFTIQALEFNPLCVCFERSYDAGKDIIIFGDDGGYVNIITILKKFWLETSSDHETFLNPSMLMRKDSLKKYGMSMYRRCIHQDWVLQVQYYSELNAFVTCSSDGINSLTLGDLERKIIRSVSVSKGVRCFEFCKRPSFLVCGGRDGTLRLYNPYVLSKPAATLLGHLTTIMSIKVNNEEGHIISMSEDKVIKVWNARNLNCLQTLTDKIAHRPENIISALYYDNYNQQLISGHTKIDTWPIYKNSSDPVVRNAEGVSIIAAIFNENFHQVVTGNQNGTITIWDLESGEKIFEFHKAHGEFELTAMCFDKSRRRLLTGSRDGFIKMWNFNNGQMLLKMIKDSDLEVTDISYIEMGANKLIVAVGWDKKINIFIDDTDHAECKPARVLNGSGNSTHRGHEDDMSSICFCPPNTMATSSVEGKIVIWNLESGAIKGILYEPFLGIRGLDELSIEKIAFLLPTDISADAASTRKYPLVSCHADGYVRFWDAQDMLMLHEILCQTQKNEGATTLAIDSLADILIIGTSKGYIRIFDVKSLNLEIRRDIGRGCILKNAWRAHIYGISSLQYVEPKKIIITSSSDVSIRIWTFEGVFIGYFGQEQNWIMDIPSTYLPLPDDVILEDAADKERRKILDGQKDALHKNVLSTWRGIAQDPIDSTGFSSEEEQGDFLRAKALNMRNKAIQAHVLQKWEGFSERKKENSVDWQITEHISTYKASKQFFTMEKIRPKRHIKQQNQKVSHDAVYSLLNYHPIEEVNQLIHSTKSKSA